MGNAISDGRAKGRSGRDVGSADGCQSGRLPSRPFVSVSTVVSNMPANGPRLSSPLLPSFSTPPCQCPAHAPEPATIIMFVLNSHSPEHSPGSLVARTLLRYTGSLSGMTTLAHHDRSAWTGWYGSRDVGSSPTLGISFWRLCLLVYISRVEY